MKMVTLTDQKLKKKSQEVKKKAGITLFRINPDEKGFDIFDEIGEIQDFIYESGVKLGEQSAGNKILEDLERTTKVMKQLRV